VHRPAVRGLRKLLSSRAQEQVQKKVNILQVADPDPNPDPDPHNLGLFDPDPDASIRGIDLDPSITKPKNFKILDSYCFDSF
jgi:hypothetical protein